MKAAVLTGIRKMEIREIPDPQIVRDTDVLIRVAAVGVCGSDIHYYTDGRIGAQVVEFPFTVGHESAGTVEDVGRGVERLKPGDRVAVDPTEFCGRCDQCLAGRENTCRELRFLGCPKQLAGSLSEYIVMHEHCLYPLPESMTFEEAALSEPLAIGVYAVQRTMPPTDELKAARRKTDELAAAVLGLGPVGLSVWHALRARKAGRVFATDKLDYRLRFASALAPVWTGSPKTSDVVREINTRAPLGMDLVYECSGDPAAIAQAIALCKPGGRLVIVGIPEVDEISLPVHELRRREITLYNIRRQAGCTQKALDLISSGAIDVKPMATHRFPLERAGEAFDLVAGYKDDVIKAMITVTA